MSDDSAFESFDEGESSEAFEPSFSDSVRESDEDEEAQLQAVLAASAAEAKKAATKKAKADAKKSKADAKKSKANAKKSKAEAKKAKEVAKENKKTNNAQKKNKKTPAKKSKTISTKKTSTTKAKASAKSTKTKTTTASKKPTKKPKAKKLTATECMDKVSSYMTQQNRPYNLICLYENLHRTIPKPTLKGTLQALCEDGVIIQKPYGKQVVFFPNQEKFEVASNETLLKYDAEIKELETELKKVNITKRSLEQLCQRLKSEPTDTELAELINTMITEVSELEAKLGPLKGPNAPKVDSNSRKLLENEVKKFVKLWKKRKRMSREVLLDISEGMLKKPKVVAELVGMELDEDVGVDVKSFKI